MIVVTGAAGFIGSNLVRSLNSHGFSNILAVDNFSNNGEKFRNLRDSQIDDLFDKHEFRNQIQKDYLPKIEIIFHQGACSNTMEIDGNYMLDNNYRMTIELFKYCQLKKIPFIYASSAAVYGDTINDGYSNNYYEKPLNIYGYSKFLCDQFLRKNLNNLTTQVVGIRYFNVYGRNETHKKKMSSFILQSIEHFQSQGYINLFSGVSGYKDGFQSRDFISVDDIISANLYCWEHPQYSGVFDCGTGISTSFNKIVHIIINCFQKKRNLTELSFQEIIDKKMIRYIPFPKKLIGVYQNYTKANNTGLQSIGFNKSMTKIDFGICKYIEELELFNL